MEEEMFLAMDELRVLIISILATLEPDALSRVASATQVVVEGMRGKFLSTQIPDSHFDELATRLQATASSAQLLGQQLRAKGD